MLRLVSLLPLAFSVLSVCTDADMITPRLTTAGGVIYLDARIALYYPANDVHEATYVRASINYPSEYRPFSEVGYGDPMRIELKLGGGDSQLTTLTLPQPFRLVVGLPGADPKENLFLYYSDPDVGTNAPDPIIGTRTGDGISFTLPRREYSTKHSIWMTVAPDKRLSAPGSFTDRSFAVSGTVDPLSIGCPERAASENVPPSDGPWVKVVALDAHDKRIFSASTRSDAITHRFRLLVNPSTADYSRLAQLHAYTRNEEFFVSINRAETARVRAIRLPSGYVQLSWDGHDFPCIRAMNTNDKTIQTPDEDGNGVAFAATNENKATVRLMDGVKSYEENVPIIDGNIEFPTVRFAQSQSRDLGYADRRAFPDNLHAVIDTQPIFDIKSSGATRNRRGLASSPVGSDLLQGFDARGRELFKTHFDGSAFEDGPDNYRSADIYLGIPRSATENLQALRVSSGTRWFEKIRLPHAPLTVTATRRDSKQIALAWNRADYPDANCKTPLGYYFFDGSLPAQPNDQILDGGNATSIKCSFSDGFQDIEIDVPVRTIQSEASLTGAQRPLR